MRLDYRLTGWKRWG